MADKMFMDIFHNVPVVSLKNRRSVRSAIIKMGNYKYILFVTFYFTLISICGSEIMNGSHLVSYQLSEQQPSPQPPISFVNISNRKPILLGYLTSAAVVPGMDEILSFVKKNKHTSSYFRQPFCLHKDSDGMFLCSSWWSLCCKYFVWMCVEFEVKRWPVIPSVGLS